MINLLFSRHRFSCFILWTSLLLFNWSLPHEAISADQHAADTPNKYANISTNQVFTILENDWLMALASDKKSIKVNLPVLAPPSVKTVNFSRSFLIPDSLQKRELHIRFTGIQGFASIKLNNIEIRHHLNFPTGITFPVPVNLLNLKGENTLEVIITGRETPDQGIPNMVRIFKPTQNLGLTGVVYLIWESTSSFKDFSYRYKDGKLSYDYDLVLPEAEIPSSWPASKIRYDEEVFDPEGQVIFKRFEYLDRKNARLHFSRTIEIRSPRLWPTDEKWKYKILLRARSDTGLLTWYEQTIGLRQIESSDGHLLINNKDLKIKGCNYRIDFPVYNDTYLGSDQKNFYQRIKEDFTDIKRLGFNAVRLPNAIAHPYCFYLSDSLGLYLFIENSFWRVPEQYFTDDRLLQAAKTVSDEVLHNFAGHPSLTALGLGNEIPVHLPTIKKFILILKGYIEQSFSLPVYLIPLNFNLIKENPVTDFYIFNKYDESILTDFPEMMKNPVIYGSHRPIFGNVGFSLRTNEESEAENIQAAQFQTFFAMKNQFPDITGYFIESYRDWESEMPSRLTRVDDKDANIYPFGLVGRSNEKRAIYHLMPELQKQDILDKKTSFSRVNKSNFFSISVFILSILFLFIYRRDYRFRENLKRSFFHPFGFFVDLRDRRIISIIDSSIIGLYTNFLVAVTLSAYLYYMRDNLLLEEYLSGFLFPLGLKNFYLVLIESPYKITLFIWLIFYILQLLIVILLKMFNLFAKENIRFRQYLAVCNWAGASLLLLLPVSLVSFHLMNYGIYHKLAVLIMLSCFFWYNLRLGNGLRVLMTMSAVKIFILIILTYCSVLFTFGAIFESEYGLITYFRLLADANPLF